jgi:hypothetical protein
MAAFKLGVFVIHGMGTQTPEFADECITQISRRVRHKGGNPDTICWQRAYWADILSPREQKLWDNLSATADMDYVRLRKFILSAFGDAIAYQRVPGGVYEDVYDLLHDRVRLHLKDLAVKMGGNLPVVVLAHSLGCAIISDYIWDRQKEAPKPGDSATERLDNLAGLVTFGCNLPLFSLAYDPVMAINFPGLTLAPELRPVAAWYNFFDPDDILGYPLKGLSPSYDAAVTKDCSINAGGIFSSWNPLSHTAYWTDDDFVEPTGDFLSQLLKAIG